MVSTTGIVTIVDLVDIYSIHLALEEYRPGRGFKARMFVTHGTRFESSEVDIEKIRKPEGIEVRVDNSSGVPEIDVEVTDPERSEGVLSIPVKVDHGTIIIYKDIPIR